MNAAWDAFRIVDNHSKSMIFQLPEDPKNEEYQDYIRTVQKPIGLEAIRVSIVNQLIFKQTKLNYRLYNDFDEFVEDMELLFRNWITFRGKGKYKEVKLSYIQSIKCTSTVMQY